MPGEEKVSSNVRDHLANERTFLAWLRTAVAVMALGFVVAKFGVNYVGFSVILGVGLIAMGAVMQILALSRYSMNQRRIDAGSYAPSKGLETSFSIVVLLIALLLAVYLALSA